MTKTSITRKSSTAESANRTPQKPSAVKPGAAKYTQTAEAHPKRPEVDLQYQGNRMVLDSTATAFIVGSLLLAAFLAWLAYKREQRRLDTIDRTIKRALEAASRNERHHGKK
jgi:hypothetical protein